MLLKIALGLLGAWVIGVLGVYDGGPLVHVSLLVGLMLLMLAFLKARDSMTPPGPGTHDSASKR